MKAKLKYLVLAIGAILMVSTFSIAGSAFSDPNETEIVMVSLEGEDDISSLNSAGIEILERYPDKALVELSGESRANLNSMGIQVVEELSARTKLNVKGHQFDINEMPELSDDLSIDGYEEGEEGIYLVHMLGPVHPEWRGELESMGVEIINYQPNYAYEVSMTPEQAEEIEDLFFVDWVGPYQPAFKMAEDLEPGLISVSFASGQRTIIRVEDEAELVELANKNDVYHISQYQTPELQDEMATQIVGGGAWISDSDNDPDTAYRAQGSYGSLVNQLGYEGDGVVTAVADTGLGDGNTGDAGHPDFEDRVIGGYGYESGGRGALTGSVQEASWEDGQGHGTHVAGSIGANTHEGTGEQVYNDYYSGQGTAPGTDLFAVKIFDDSGSYIGPGNDYHEIVEISKQEANAYVHSNSWGFTSDEGAYLKISEDYDAAVRDADRATDRNDPMVIVVAAGNSGSDHNTIQAPATGKNVISVGGTENYNPDQGVDNPDNMYDLSSRGWTNDNRIKPDLVAPAEEVYSTKLGGTWDPGPGYEYKSGTSMATPAVSGSAAVVVDWYEDTYGEKPSPAMVKGLLINTAYDLDDTNGDTSSIPNKDEGWGMVNLPALIDSSVNFNMKDQTSLMKTGEVEEHYVEHDNGGEPLKITLTWTDKNALEGDDPTLKNDLDLEIESPSGDIYTGNSFTNGWTSPGYGAMSDFDSDGDGDDDVNTVENIYIHPDDLEEGPYTVRVIGENIPADANGDGDANQDYSLVMQNTVEVEGPSISLNHPTGGETFGQGSTETIQWTTEAGDVGIDTVDLEYSNDGGNSWSDIATGLSDTGSYDWTVPEEGTMKGKIRATVHDVDSLSDSNTSDSFTIAPQIMITSPEGGDIWNVGYDEDIKWTTTEASGSSITGVDLEYSPDGGASWNTIVENTDDDGIHTWTVPDHDTEQAMIRANISDDAGRTDEDVSSKFTIRTPEPQEPINPDPEDGETGVSIEPELSVYVEHDAGESMNVSFYDASDDSLIGKDENVASGTRASVPWGNRDYNTTYGWYVKSTDDEITVQSETWSFTTREVDRPSIFLNRPRAGAIWSPGDEEPITWGTREGEGGNISYVDLEYSIDDGDSWIDIATGLADDGSYDWTVPNNPTEEARIRASVEDEEGWTDEDVSDQFTISAIEHTLTIYEPNGDGTVEVDDQQITDWPYEQKYENGTEVELKAVPESGWYFAEWTGDYQGTEDTITLTMDEDKNVTANFEEIMEYTLKINIEGQGSTTPSEGTHTYRDGENVTIMSSPDSGWYFHNWTGDHTDREDTITISMDEDKEITANFKEIKDYLLEIYVEGEGIVNPPEGTHTYYEDEQVTLTATPDEDKNNYFKNWTGDVPEGEENSENIIITMDEDKTITANFEVYKYELNITVNGEGSVERDPEDDGYVHGDEYEHGTEVELTAESDTGWYFTEWTGEDAPPGEEDSETIIITMDEDKELTANFEIHKYTLEISEEGKGSVNIDPDQYEYDYGTQVTLTAEPDEHWNFDEWTGDYIGEEDEVTITMDKDKVITAHFEERRYSLDVDTEGDGSVEVTPQQYEYEPETEVTLTADPYEGWYLDEWTGTDETGEEITIVMDEDKTITAHFEVYEYDIEISIEGEGSTDPSNGTHTYEHGEKVTITVTADEDWYFVEWTGDYQGTEKAITVEMKEDKEITAHFEEYEPAYFEVEIIDYDKNVKKGEEITVKYRVNNTGELSGTQDITLYMGGEEVEVQSDLTLAPGEEYEDEFTIEADEVGEQTLEIGSNDETSEGSEMTIEEKEDTGDDDSFLSNYWWIIPLILIGLVLAVLLFVMKGKEEEEEEEPFDEPTYGAAAPSQEEQSQESPWDTPSDEGVEEEMDEEMETEEEPSEEEFSEDEPTEEEPSEDEKAGEEEVLDEKLEKEFEEKFGEEE